MFEYDLAFPTSAVIFSILTVFLITIMVDIRRKRCSESHSFQSMLSHYVILKAMTFLGFIRRRKLETITRACGKFQEELLMDILKANGRTVYGTQHGLSDVKNKFEFVTKHPLTRYGHYQKHIGKVQYILSLLSSYKFADVLPLFCFSLIFMLLMFFYLPVDKEFPDSIVVSSFV